MKVKVCKIAISSYVVAIFYPSERRPAKNSPNSFASGLGPATQQILSRLSLSLALSPPPEILSLIGPGESGRVGVAGQHEYYNSILIT